MPDAAEAELLSEGGRAGGSGRGRRRRRGSSSSSSSIFVGGRRSAFFGGKKAVALSLLLDSTPNFLAGAKLRLCLPKRYHMEPEISCSWSWSIFFGEQ